METLNQLQKKYCPRTLVVAIVVAFGFILAGQKGIGKGLVLGTLFSIANFSIMAYLLPMKLDKSRGKTFLTAMLSIGGRYALMAVPLILSLKLEQFSFPATAAGLFMVQLVILAEHGLKAVKARKLGEI